ncbi:hypothetical protein HHK36_015673 [Tetracentron sinense]|uniref:Cytochrome P450 n=1 Tax=Tetracentron sinense TaxID=13715 RepID=A0A834ZC78_TETSI|nr:hypothetical protein HHK36_015673 [Tetracentron sinense]
MNEEKTFDGIMGGEMVREERTATTTNMMKEVSREARGVANGAALDCTVFHWCESRSSTLQKNDQVERPNLPPSPPKLPIIGHLYKLRKFPHDCLSQLSKIYGPVMLVHLGRVPMVVVSSAEMAKEVLKTHDLDCCSRPPMTGPKKLSYNFLDVVFVPYGEYWREMRKIFALEIFGAKRVQSFRRVREDEVARMVNSISQSSTSPVNLTEKLFSLTDNITCRVAFGRSYEGKVFDNGRLHELLGESLDIMASFNATEYFPPFGWIIDVLTGIHARVEKHFHAFDSFYQRIIDEHLDPQRPKPEHEDVIDFLLGLERHEFGTIRFTKDHIKAILMRWKKVTGKETRKLPPGPSKLPLIGNLHQLGYVPHQSLQELSHEYGPLMFLQLGSIPSIVVSSAEMAREIFKTHDLVFSSRPIMYAANKISYGCSDIAFAPYGEYWREVRKITIMELLSAKRTQSFRAVREEELDLMVSHIAHSSPSPVNLSNMMVLLVNDVICRVVFGKKCKEEGEIMKSRFHVILLETQDLLGGFTIADFFPSLGWINKFNGLEARLQKNFSELDSYYDEIIEERLDPKWPQSDHEYLVDVLLRVQKDSTQAITLTRDQIKGVITRWKKLTRKETRKPPPGPRKLPLIGNLHQLGYAPHQSLQELSHEYGPLMFLQLGSIPSIVVSSAEMAREIFKTHDLVFSSRPIMYAANKISYGCSDIAFAPYGEYWREVRKITIMELLSAKRTQSFRAVREEELDLMVSHIAHSSPSPVNLSNMMVLLVNDVICRVVFGKKCKEEGEIMKSRFHVILLETQDLLGGFTIADFFPSLGWINKFNGLEARLQKNFSELDSYYDEIIEERLDPKWPQSDHEYLVDVLLRVQKDSTQAITLTRDQIKGVITLGSIPSIVISSADMAREIFKTHDLVFSSRPIMYAAKKLSYGCSDIAFTEYWREVRKIAILELLSVKRTPIVSSGKGRRAGLHGFTIADFLPSLGWINKFNGLEARLQKNFSELDSYYDEIIEERLDPKWPQSGHEYLFDVLLRVQKDPTQAITLTRDQIKGVLTVCVFPYTPFPWFS